MRSILEKAFVALLNEEHDKAEELFHKFIVERARQIHETNRAGDDYVLDENWNDEITSEHYFTEDDLADLEDGEGDAVDADADVDVSGAEVGDDFSSDSDDLSDDEEDMDMDQDDLSMDHEEEGELEGTEERLDHLEDQLNKLVAEFEAKMDEFGGDATDEFSDEDNTDDFGGEDDGFGASDDEDAADSVEDDMDGADEDDVPMESAEETDESMDEEYDDINESIIDELEKITVTLTDGKGVADGETFTQDRKSNLPQKKIDARQGGTPIKMKQDAHKGFERETAPAVKDMKKMRNNVRSDKEVLAQKVSKEGNKSAELNKLSSETGNQKSPIEGKGGRGPVEV